ncbi:MAG: NCS2 family permease, partial [Bacteroidales bacterium]|nr:NCS2 family permease [Candidatus Sodaliphilus fimicaballi]
MLTKIFGFDPKTMTLKKEVMGGITTFLTMAYILAVNPSILGDAGMDAGAVFTATVVSAIVATLVMAMYAKLPFALAPGMGLNAFFAYTVVLTMGYTWQFALTAVLIEGIIFILLTLTGLRMKIVNCMPLLLRRAISPGIGLFIAFIGLKNAGIVTDNAATLVSLGNLHDPAVLLACFGILLSVVLLVRNVTGALLIG